VFVALRRRQRYGPEREPDLISNSKEKKKENTAPPVKA